VFKVRNLKLDRLEAFKVLDDPDDTDEGFGVRFANEARVAASLDHPSIVKVYDSGEVEGTYWYTMQFIAGPTVSELLRTSDLMDQDQAARLALPLLDALDYSHQRGVIHRDIKPSNIILDAHGRPYLMDYGIAKTADSMLRTRTGLILGTPAYVAPEQASLQELDGRADLYALGVTLYEALTGCYHFTADNPLQTVVMRMTDDPEPLLDKRADLDPAFAAVVMRALERDPVHRFSSAAEMRDALIPFAGDGWRPTDPGRETATRGIDLPLPPPGKRPQSQPTILTGGPHDHPARGTAAPPARRWVRWAIGAAAGTIVLALALSLGEWPLGGGDPVAEEITDPGLARSTASSSAAALSVASAVPAQVTATRAPSPEPPPATARPTRPPTFVPAPTATPAPPPRRPMTSPRLKDDSRIRLPASALPICAGQVVNLSLVVGEDGRVVRARVISAAHPGCGEAAAAAVMELRYEPALAADQLPVETTIAIAIPFKEVENEPESQP